VNQPRALRSVSMTDVAVHAGVSQKTVSRVVNDEPHVKPELREKVLAAIAELGFRPNAAARALASKRTRRIGMVSIGTTLHGPASIITGVEEASRANGYFLSVVRTEGHDLAAVQNAVDVLISQGVEAIVLSEPVQGAGVGVHVPAGIRIQTFGDPLTDVADELTFGIDEFGGARDATEHLLALGHETVWHISGPIDWASTRRRIEGWRAALLDADVAQPPVVTGAWTPQSGYDAMRSILHRDDVTALFIANDEMAIGALAAIRDAGLRVPEDVSVIGFDDISTAAFLTVPLTTVRQDLAEATRLGMHRLFRALEGHPPIELQRTAQVQLVTRASTAAPNPERRAVKPA
jgi:DNA-binding LacI/PurR family transcriptional regulator